MPKKSSTEVKRGDVNWEMLLWDAPSHHIFHCSDGSVFKSLEELKEALSSMSEETFDSHVNEHKNDFSTWVYDIVGDCKLADDLRHLHTLSATLKKVRSRVTYIKRKIRESGD